MKHIFIYQDLLTNKISDIGQTQTQNRFMEDHFTVTKSQSGAQYHQLELLVHIFRRMTEEGLLTVNAQHYTEMLENFLTPSLACLPINDEYFQQATLHVLP